MRTKDGTELEASRWCRHADRRRWSFGPSQMRSLARLRLALHPLCLDRFVCYRFSSSSAFSKMSSEAQQQDAGQPSVASSSNDRLPSFPVSGVVGIVKPSGPTSMSLLDALKPLLAASKVFQDVSAHTGSGRPGRNRRKRFRGGDGSAGTPKLGQGGTLDPLADGVLVIGIGAGTKRLQDFLACSKEYRTVGLLGASTLSYDSEDPILQRAAFDHVTPDVIRDILPSFRGKQNQLPPLFSAVKVDGKRLFDYAREGKDLPRPIEGRSIEIQNIALADWKPAGEHTFHEPARECSEEERTIAIRARQLAGLEDGQGAEGGEEQRPTEKAKPAPAFTLDMTVSSGTYVRSVVHDIGLKAGSAAHVVKLTRTRQGKWVVPGYEEVKGKSVSSTEERKEAVDWSVLQRAIDRHNLQRKSRKVSDGKDVKTDEVHVADGGESAIDEDGLEEWERILLERCVNEELTVLLCAGLTNPLPGQDGYNLINGVLYICTFERSQFTVSPTTDQSLCGKIALDDMRKLRRGHHLAGIMAHVGHIAKRMQCWPP